MKQLKKTLDVNYELALSQKEHFHIWTSVIFHSERSLAFLSKLVVLRLTILTIIYSASTLIKVKADLLESVFGVVKGIIVNKSDGDELSTLTEVREVQLTKEEIDKRTNYWMIKKSYQSINDYKCDVKGETIDGKYKLICFLDRKSKENIAVIYYADSSSFDNEVMEAKVSSCDLSGLKSAFYSQNPESGVHKVIAVYKDKCESITIGLRFSSKEECPRYPGEESWEEQSGEKKDSKE